MAVCGANGSGKSTLLKLIAGLDENDSGAITRNKGAAIGWVNNGQAQSILSLKSSMFHDSPIQGISRKTRSCPRMPRCCRPSSAASPRSRKRSRWEGLPYDPHSSFVLTFACCLLRRPTKRRWRLRRGPSPRSWSRRSSG